MGVSDVLLPAAGYASGWAVLGLVVYGFYRAVRDGALIPRKTHEDRVGDLKEANAAQKATIDTQLETIRERERQISILLGARPREIE